MDMWRAVCKKQRVPYKDEAESYIKNIIVLLCFLEILVPLCTRGFLVGSLDGLVRE